METRGKFIILEGASGSGKSAQLIRLKAAFPDYYFDFEPSDELYGEFVHHIIEQRKLSDTVLDRCLAFGDEKFDFWKDIHRIIRAVASQQPINELEIQMLYMADRIWNLEKKYIPKLEAGISVILDRYFYSTLAYGYSGGVDMERLWEIQKQAFASSEYIGDLWRPDLLFILDVPAEIAVRRLQASGKVMDIFEKLSRLGKIREGYRILSKMSDLLGKTVVIDATQAPESVFGIIYKEIISGRS